MIKKTTIAAAALLAFAVPAAAETVSHETALAVVEGFIKPGRVGARILPDRSVASAAAWGSLWIVCLEPSGYVVIAGSDKCAPIVSFSPENFVEPEAGSPLDALLRGQSDWVDAVESDSTAETDPGWAKYAASPVKKVLLLAAAPTVDSTADDYPDGFVAPLLGAMWGQNAPYNDLSPLYSLCGCVATAGGQEHRYWRWPYRYETSNQYSHSLRNSLDEHSQHVIRVDGRVPFDYDKIWASYPNPASTPLAADKVATYNAAYLSLWMQSLTHMIYKPGGSGAAVKIGDTHDKSFFEYDRVYSMGSDGYTNLWNAIKADIDWGSPVQINTPAHQMVVDGYAIEDGGTENEVDYINVNLGYGYTTHWTSLRTAVTSGDYSGVFAHFQIGYRPKKMVQFEPLPKVCDSDVTLVWHLPPCYTNRTTGFTLEIAGAGGAQLVATKTINTHGETTAYTATGLETGVAYTFTVTPIMANGEGTGVANSVTTTIGTPATAPEILGVSSVACGIELVQQDIFAECARGIVNQFKVTCSESVTSLAAYSSHLTVLPDEKISVVAGGTRSGSSEWTVSLDATEMKKDWDGDMLLLTLVAANADGTETAKNLMLRFNSMRNVMGGTFDVADANASSAVWFAGGYTTTLDAKGQAVTFAAGAVNGTGTLVLTDSVGGGSFTFAGLDGFTGTLILPSADITTTLPNDLSNFEGTLIFTSGNYALSGVVSASAKIVLDGAEDSYDDVTIDFTNVDMGATVSGWGTINISMGTCTFTKTVASNSTLVNLAGGTLTIPADDSSYSFVKMNGGTLKVLLTKAQTELGYDWTLPLYQSGEVKFILADGTEESAAVVTKDNLPSVSHATDANVWTGTDYWNNSDRYADTAKWSKNALPGDGDYVIFNSAENAEEGNEYGSAMVLNLPSPANLGYVQVRGASGLEITTVNGISTAILKADVLENQVVTKIKATQFQPQTVIPKRTLYISSGYALTCDLDCMYADNLKRSNSSESALTSSDYWQGTVVFNNYTANLLYVAAYGNSMSKVRFSGVSGSFASAQEFAGTVELVDGEDALALDCRNGNASYAIFGKLSGDGTFKTSGDASGQCFIVKDVSNFTGSFNLATKTLAIADEKPSSYTGTDGRLHVCKTASISADKTWAANGGIYLGGGAALTVEGTLSTSSSGIVTCSEGTSLTLEDGGTIEIATPMSGDYATALDFKAGTLRFLRGLTETKTVVFCAADGKYATLDAFGNAIVLGKDFFSGSGDVYLTSSKPGGSFVLEGVGESFTGTIRADISAGVTLSGDISQSSGTIAISDILLTVPSSSLGNVEVGAGSTLFVTVSKGHRISGLEIDASQVSLVDGGTLVLQDTDGKALATFTAGDAVDGKYVLAPDASLSPVCVLDYEFNGNMASVGTDPTALSIYNGSASYYEGSAIYTRCVPYINKDFAMPDDEWTTFIRCTLPVADSEKPTIVLMYGVNGGNLFGLVAGTNANTVALADKNGLIGEAVTVENATTKYHVYTIVKTSNRVRLYVDGELKVNELATISVAKKFQIGSVHSGNYTSYGSCTDQNAHIDFLKFYDFAASDDFIKSIYTGPKPIAVWTGDFDTTFDGCSLDWHDNQFADGAITIMDGYRGVDVNLASGTNAITVIVKYSDLSYSTSNGRVFFTSCADSGATYDRTAVRLTTGNAVGGSHNSLTSSGTAANDYAATISAVPASSGYMVFSYGHPSDNGNRGTLVCSGVEEGGLDTTNYWHSGLMYAADSTGNNIHGATIGGSRQQTSTWKNAAGMKIEAIAVFTERLSAEERDEYSFPWPKIPVLAVSPASGEVEYGSKLTASCDDEAATIWYKKYGEADYTEYTEPISLTTPGINYYYFHIKDAGGNIVVTDTLFTYMVGEPPDELFVAQIEGGSKYMSLQDAIDAASGDAANPSTITLLKSSGDAVTLNKTIVLNENGCTFGSLSGTGTLCVIGALPSEALKTLLQNPDNWRGTFSLSGYTSKINNFSFNWWGNSNSVVRVDGINGYAGYVGGSGGTSHIAQIRGLQIVGDGVEFNDAFGLHQVYIDAPVTGTGKFAFKTKNSYPAASSGTRFIFTGNMNGYVGEIDCSADKDGGTACSTVVFLGSAEGTADDLPTATEYGQIIVTEHAEIVLAGKWATAGGVMINGVVTMGSAAAITGNIALAETSATLTVPDGATAAAPGTTVANAYVKKVGDVYSVMRAFVVTPENIDALDSDEVGELPLVFRVIYTPDGSEATVTNMYENILVVAAGRIALDPDGEVDGVVVRPELDEDAARPYDAEGETITIKSIPGLWYSTFYGDALVNGGIGGETGETEARQATEETLTLAAPRGGATRFYKVRVAPLSATSGDRQQMLSSRLRFSQEAVTGLQLLQNRGEED